MAFNSLAELDKQSESIVEGPEKYNKISRSKIQEFLDKISLDNISIRQASKNFNINYSTAKKMYVKYQKNTRYYQQQTKCSIESPN